ncbi:unnamed protein product [Closterium sp. NIES-64]|nr:unnamed protein product [Closterium sp. NIES-64]
MEIEEEQSPPQHQQRRPGSKAAPMAAWLVEARDGSLSLSEDALAFAIAEWRMSGATKSARIHLVHVLTHISVDRDMMRLPISEVSPMTADTHEKNMRAMLLDPLVKFALKNEADVDIIVVRNDDRKAGMLEIAKQLSPHRVFVSANTLRAISPSSLPPPLPHFPCFPRRLRLRQARHSSHFHTPRFARLLNVHSAARFFLSCFLSAIRFHFLHSSAFLFPSPPFRPSMFGKRSAIAIIEALSGPFFAAHLPDNARLVALQGKKVLKDITIGSPGSCAASPVVELARGNAAARDAHYLSAPQTPPRGFLSPAGSRKFSPPAEREQRADSTSPPASSASANGAAAATSSSSGSAKLSAKLTSFWRTSSQDLSGSQSGPQRSESLGSPPRSLKSASPADSNRSFKQQSQPRPPSPGYFDASHSSKWGEKASQGGKKAPMKPGIVVDGRGGAEAHGQGGADADGLEVTLVEGETPRSRGGVRGGASMPFRRCSEEGKAADAGHADASDGPFDGRSSTTGSLVATRPPHRNALPSLPSISSQPGCLHLDAGTVAGATGNFSDRLCLMPRHPLVRAYNGYMGGIQIVAAQMSGPDWLSGPADPESASSAPSPFEAAAQRFIAPLEHAHICPLLGCSPSLRCLVYPRPPGSTSLATRLACCGAGGGGSGGAMSRTSSSGSLVHRSSSAGSFNSPDSSTSERFVEGSAGNGPVGTRSLGGGSLRPLSWQTRLKIVTQTCRALTWLHQQSPPIAAGCLGVETVLLTRDDSCKLLLAGVAALAADPGKMSEKLNREMGMEGYICLAEDGGERKGREGLGVGWNEGGKEIGKGQSGGAEAGDVFALGLLMLHLLTGWVDGGAVRQLLAACWAAADIHRAVEVVARAARQSCQMQPCCDWPDGVLYSLAMVALECAEECQEWRPVLVGCVMDQFESPKPFPSHITSFIPSAHYDRLPPRHLIPPPSVAHLVLRRLKSPYFRPCSPHPSPPSFLVITTPLPIACCDLIPPSPLRVTLSTSAPAPPIPLRPPSARPFCTARRSGGKQGRRGGNACVGARVVPAAVQSEHEAEQGCFIILTRRDGGKKKKGQQCACWGTSGDAEEWGEEEEGAAVRVLRHEWRVLRFNESTRQSVARVATVAVDVTVTGESDVTKGGKGEGERRRVILQRQQPDCLAFECAPVSSCPLAVACTL